MTAILENFARVSLCHQPTAIEKMQQLTAYMGGPRLWVKRDDCTGLATGGNKTRKLEFLMAEALAMEADCVVTQGAVQSNHVRQTAAAACRLGIKPYALLERRVTGKPKEYDETGNVFFDQLFGSKIEFRDGGLDMNAEALALTDRLRAEGKNPYFIPGGGSNAVGALGYVSCAQEILAQIQAQNIQLQAIVHATGSTGTQAGLVAGLHALGSTLPVIGVSVRQPQERQIEAVWQLATKTAALLTDRPLEKEKIIVFDGYVGNGYGVPTPGGIAATKLLASKEGLLLDLVYSAKGMDGMLDLISNGYFSAKGDILFIHTGGAASLFAYQDSLV